MKRQFMKSFMALCAGVMTLCAASSLFVSCYDDSELRGQIEELDKRVQNLEELKAKLDALTASVDKLYTIKFQVSANHELQYSFDGGQTWTSTGVFLAEECDCEPCTHECPPCQYVPCEHECPEVSLVDNGDSVTIKIGNAEFTIEKPQEIVFELRAGKVYFQSEGTVTVAIKSSGVEDITVMSAPKGWWADINSEGKVEVTAPNFEDTQVQIDYETWTEIPAKYAASGYVKIHACAADGKCMVGKLPVEVVEQALSVKAYGNSAYFSVASDYEWGPTYFYGAATKETLEAETSGLLKAMSAGGWDHYDTYANTDATDLVVTMAELLGEEPQLGNEYIVWAVVEDYSKMSYSAEDLVIAYYSPLQVTLAEVEEEKTAYNVTVNVDVVGAESYVAVALPALYCDDPDYTKEQMTMALSQGQYYGKLYTESYSGSALDIAAGTTYSMTGLYSPASEVYVFVLPIDGRPVEDYTAADVVMGVYSTAELTAGGSIDLTVEQVTSYIGEVYDYEIWDYVTKEIVLDPYTQLGVKVTPSSETDWTAFYYSWMTDADYAMYEGYDEDIVAYLLENAYGNTPSDVKWPSYIVEQVAPKTTMHFVAFIVDAAGKYGKVAHVEATSQELAKADFVWVEPFTTNLTDGVLKNSQTLKFTPLFEDGKEAASYKYVLAQTKYYNQYEGKTDAQMAEELYFSTSSEVKTVSAEELMNGVLYVDGHNYGYPYYFAIVPIDADGNPGASAAILEYETVFELDEALTEGEAFEATKPQITLNLPPVEEFYPDGGWGDAAYYGYEDQTEWGYGYHYYYEIGFAVDPVEGTEVIAQYVDTQSYTLGSTAAAKAGQLWSESLGFGAITTTEPVESAYKYISNYWDEPAPAIILCVSWKDAEGTIYYMDIDVQPELQKLADRMTAMINGEGGDDEDEPVAELSVEGKQWIFSWDAMGVTAMVDFGVSAENYFYLAYDASAYGMDGYLEYIGSEYSVTPSDETSGVITLVTYNMFGEPITMDIAYSELTETTCKFVNTDIMLCDLEGNPVVATVSEEVLPVTPNGVAI